MRLCWCDVRLYLIDLFVFVMVFFGVFGVFAVVCIADFVLWAGGVVCVVCWLLSSILVWACLLLFDCLLFLLV